MPPSVTCLYLSTTEPSLQSFSPESVATLVALLSLFPQFVKLFAELPLLLDVYTTGVPQQVWHLGWVFLNDCWQILGESARQHNPLIGVYAQELCHASDTLYGRWPNVPLFDLRQVGWIDANQFGEFAYAKTFLDALLVYQLSKCTTLVCHGRWLNELPNQARCSWPNPTIIARPAPTRFGSLSLAYLADSRICEGCV